MLRSAREEVGRRSLSLTLLCVLLLLPFPQNRAPGAAPSRATSTAVAEAAEQVRRLRRQLAAQEREHAAAVADLERRLAAFVDNQALADTQAQRVKQQVSDKQHLHTHMHAVHNTAGKLAPQPPLAGGGTGCPAWPRDTG